MFTADRFAAILGIAGFFIAMLVVGRLLKRPASDLAISVILSGIVGARLVHILVHAESFMAEPLRVFYVWQGGFNVWGGILGIALALALQVRKLPLLASTIAATIVGFGIWGGALLLVQQTTGAPLPRTALMTIEGERINLAQFRGEPMVINLWASWCPPCVREMPMFAEAARENPGVNFVFVNQGEGADDIEAFLAYQNLSLEHVILDPTWAVSRNYDARGLPATLFINSDGIVSAVYAGEVSPELMEDRVSALQ
ncbi:prolipoprotein diacylglyceryl transferase family protein [Pelagibacterium sp.]|uniref:prolipoprotein diacylglyceryl transferase family protein n=1 Tax=Pelagibacterium sp. TaxID=1967288 RepID=UPI003A908B4A